MQKTISPLEAMGMNRRDRRILGKINKTKIPSIKNLVPENKEVPKKESAVVNKILDEKYPIHN